MTTATRNSYTTNEMHKVFQKDQARLAEARDRLKIDEAALVEGEQAVAEEKMRIEHKNQDFAKVEDCWLGLVQGKETIIAKLKAEIISLRGMSGTGGTDGTVVANASRRPEDSSTLEGDMEVDIVVQNGLQSQEWWSF